MIQFKHTIGNLRLLTELFKRIGIIGARNSSANERMKAYFIAHEIVESEGHVVVSGLAHGIDTFAHMGGIGRTVAVLNNLNNPYPKENWRLIDDIMSNDGLIMSPYNQFIVDKKSFLDRDRMLVDVCDEIIVVGHYEIKSGTAYTVDYAEQKGVKVTEIKV